MFEKAIKIDSKFVNAYYNKGISCIFLLGKSLYCLQRFEETLEAIDQVILLDSKFVEAYNTKGEIYI